MILARCHAQRSIIPLSYMVYYFQYPTYLPFLLLSVQHTEISDLRDRLAGDTSAVFNVPCHLHPLMLPASHYTLQ